MFNVICKSLYLMYNYKSLKCGPQDSIKSNPRPDPKPTCNPKYKYNYNLKPKPNTADNALSVTRQFVNN